MPSNKTPQSKETGTIETQEIAVMLSNNRTAIVKVEGDGFLLDDGSLTRRYTFATLLGLARRGEMPEWCGQIRGLSERIEAVFQGERNKGRDPFGQCFVDRGRLVVVDLKTGTSHGADLVGLRKLLRDGQRLPKAFDSPQARRLIDSAA